MKAAQPIPRPVNEEARLTALNKYQMLDTAPEPDFDFLAELAATMCGAPYAFISLVDTNRVWYKSSRGLAATEFSRDGDYCSWAILEDELLHIPDLTSDTRTATMPLTTGAPHYRMYCGANLATDAGQHVGTLCVLDTQARQLSEAQQTMLLHLARLVVALMDLRLRDRELRAALSAMHQLASEDVLTGLLNRRALLEALQLEANRSQRFDSGLALLMLDLDHFKLINDRYGHGMGDAVLRGVGRALRGGIRSIDLAGRYGGEELCVVLPGTDLAGAMMVAESLRRSIASLRHQDGDQSVGVTVSIGVAVADQGLTGADGLLRAADAALYRAKESGRNRVMSAGSSAASNQAFPFTLSCVS